MTQVYTTQLGLIMGSNNFGAQKIDDLSFEMDGMVIGSFLF